MKSAVIQGFEAGSDNSHYPKTDEVTALFFIDVFCV